MYFRLNRWMVFAFFFVLFLNSCTVTQEKYRYQQRFDHFYSLLSDSQKRLFRKNSLEELGKSIDDRKKSDAIFAVGLKKVTEYEAIATFSGSATASFFRDTILRELNRPHFYRLMNSLSGEDQVRFIRRDFTVLEKIENRKFKKLMNEAVQDYRLVDFTPEEVFDYYRNVSFNEVARRHLFLLLSILKEAKILDYFIVGRVDEAAKQLDGAMKNNVALEMKLDELKKLSSLTHVSSLQLLRLYSEIVMKEMDPKVLERTIGKFY